MKRSFLFFVVSFFFCTTIFTQEKFSQEAFETLASSLKEIESNGNTFEQKLELQESGSLLDLAFETTIIDKKGKSNIERFEFNLIDLDPRLLRREVKSKTMFLTLKTDDSQKMIKYFENGEQENYRNYFSIAVDGVDDCRQLEELFETAIKTARKEESLDLSKMAFGEQLNFLKENIKTVKINDGEYDQVLVIGQPNYLLQLKVEDGTAKTSESTETKFNLADLLEKSIKINVSGKKLLVKVSTQNGKRWVQNYEEGKFKSYGSAVEFVTNNTTEARNISSALKQLISGARKQEKANMEALVKSDAERIKLLSDYITDVSTEKKEIKQDFEGDCIVKFSQTTLESNDKSIINEYAFNFIDFEKKKTSVQVSSSALSVKITGELKLVKYIKDGAIQNYRNNLSFEVAEIEDAKKLAFLLEQQIERCQEKANGKTLSGGTPETLLANCEKYISDIDLSSYTYKQKLEAVDNVPCKLQMTQTKSDKNKDTEVLFEFNLNDMNPKSIDFDISGKELSVKLYTKNKEKVIKRYLGDEKSDYVDNLEIFMDDVESTRNLIGLFKELVNACAE